MNEKQANLVKNVLSNFGTPVEITDDFGDARIVVDVMNRESGTMLLSPYLMDLGVKEQTLWAIYYGSESNQSGKATVEVGIYGVDSNDVTTGTSFTFTQQEFLSPSVVKMVINAYCVGVYHGKSK